MPKIKNFGSVTLERGNLKYIRQAFERYCNSSDYKLSNIYSTYSEDKEEAYEKCLNLVWELGGKDYRIPTFNSWSFTFAFRFENEGVQYFCYITPTHKRYIELNSILYGDNGEIES